MKLEMLTSARRNPAVTDKCAMGIVIKAPRAGFSKTRLSPPLSQEEAASISRCFLKDTTAVIDALSHEDPFVVGVAIYTPVGSEADFAELLPRSFKNHRPAWRRFWRPAIRRNRRSIFDRIFRCLPDRL